MSVNKIRINQTQFSVKDGAVAAGQSIANPLTGAPDTVDGVTMQVGFRVIIIGGGTLSGLWVVVTVGTGSDGVWERPEDFLDGDVMMNGTMVQIGGQGATRRWVTFVGGNGSPTTAQLRDGFVIGTDNITFIETTPFNVLFDGALIRGEVMSGTIDSSNLIFETQDEVTLEGEITVFLNGQAQVSGVDYTYSVASGLGRATFNFAPKSAPGNPDIVTASYQLNLGFT